MAVKEKEELTDKNDISEERKKALKTAIDKIEKDFGKGSIMRLGDKPAVNVETIPTGALSLDVALGIGGIPRGRIIEVYGLVAAFVACDAGCKAADVTVENFDKNKPGNPEITPVHYCTRNTGRMSNP